MNREQMVIAFIRDELLEDSEVQVTAETSLFQDRLLDSLNLVSLIAFLEKNFSVNVSPSEVTIENFDNVGNVIKYLDQKTNFGESK